MWTEVEWETGVADPRKVAVRRLGAETKLKYRVQNSLRTRTLVSWIARSAKNC